MLLNRRNTTHQYSDLSLPLSPGTVHGPCARGGADAFGTLAEHPSTCPPLRSTGVAQLTGDIHEVRQHLRNFVGLRTHERC